MRLLTARLQLDAPDRGTWSDLLEDTVGDAIAGYPTLGDVITARLVVDGHLPAGEWGPWQVRERSSGLLIGGVGFKGAPQPSASPGIATGMSTPTEGDVEIGFGLAPAARGQGYATEAVAALVEHAHARGVGAVLAECAVGNSASMGVLRRCGFAELRRTGSAIWWEHRPDR